MHECVYGRGGGRILIVHGWMHSSRLYEALALRLSERHTVHLVDLPGFGNSPPSGMKGDSLLDALSERMEQYLRDNRFDLIVAHSLGGSILLRVLDRSSASPCRQMLLCNPVYLGIRPLRRVSANIPFCTFLFRLRARLPVFLSMPFIKLAALLTINRFTLIDDIVISDARRADVPTASRLFFELCNDPWRFKRKEHRCEVTILAGERDRLIPIRSLNALKEDLGCSLEIIPRIGHTPVVEDCDFLYSRILRGMEELGE